MSTPLISVVMPVRKVSAFTHKAIDSILAQTHPTVELLLIGQANQDSPLDKHYTAAPIRWLQRKRPGIVSALNTGLEAAKGEYIARMDDDDISHPERLAIQLDHLISEKLDLCGARISFFNDNNEIGEGNQRYASWLNSLTTSDAIANSIFIECPIPHPTFFAHKNVWAQLGGYKDKPWPEDYDFILRAWKNKLRMGKPSPVLLNWREHPNRLTHTDKRYSRQAFVEAKANVLADKLSHSAMADRQVWIAGTGRNARYWFDALLKNDIETKGFVDLDRPTIKNRKRNRPVISYEELWAKQQPYFLIIALGNETARTKCISACKDAGLMEMRDFIAG